MKLNKHYNEISIIIPAYNEEKRIEPTIIKILKYIKPKFNKFELLIIDDGSKDKTIDIISKYQKENNEIKILKNIKNKGKGYSVKKGILDSKYDLVLFSDSDLATPIEELEKLKKQIDKGFDIAIASRNLNTSNIVVKQPLYRQILGNLFPYFVQIIAVSGIKDTQCGFKMYKNNVAKEIAKRQTLERFSFDVEQLFIAKKMKYKIAEVGVTWIDKEGSKVSTIKDGLRMLRDLFIIRLNHSKGIYKK
ncbi:MAG: dolichyl-phosphate beta-glucosyltransferase [Nanoarchaeota archaeon]